MTNENYTSLKLSKLFAENGCRIESEYFYVDTRKSCKKYNCPLDFKFIPFRELDENDVECELVENKKPLPNQGYNNSEPLPAYDIIWDICIRHAKEFFGEEDVYGSCGIEILKLRQQNKNKEAEEIIWDVCLFNPKNK